jgi:DNA helicase-2/ATP-dependent DNA helicase PcrA
MNLRLYLCRKQPNGNNRSPSPYLDWLTSREITEIANPVTMPNAVGRGPLSLI